MTGRIRQTIMTEDYRLLVRETISNSDVFVKAVFSGQRRGHVVPWRRVAVRPVLIRNKRHIQFSYFDDKKDITKNYTGADVMDRLDDLLDLSFGSITLHTVNLVYQIQFTKKGRTIIHRHQVDEPQQPSLHHDRRKSHLLPVGQPDSFLHMIGIMTAEGAVKASMQGKFRQINEFLKLIDETGELDTLSTAPITIVDCGCGSAYLTFSTYHYLNNILGLPTRMIGIDSNAELVRRRAEQSLQLGWESLSFEACRIIDFEPDTSPDIVLALHACDTASDEALAQAVRWQSRMIFCAPCCHHHLQRQLETQPPPEEFAPVLRHNVFKERLGDVLTDAFRSSILDIMGYRTQIVEFVSTEHTGKNLMIRAIHSPRSGEADAISAYQTLKDFWGVTPYLERLLQVEMLALNAISQESAGDEVDYASYVRCHTSTDDFSVTQ
jgi:SAM-dependent methyltransferase